MTAALVYNRVLKQRSFNFPQLDPYSVDLDLVILPARMDNASIR